MSDCLTNEQIEAITERKQGKAQARVLRDLGYVVLGINPEGHVRCLATHPDDPSLKAANDRGDTVRLNLGT